MALLFIDSFDHYDLAHLLGKWTTGGITAVRVGQGRCATNCAELDSAVSVRKGLTFGSASCTVGFAFKVLVGTVNTILPLRLAGTNGTHLQIAYYPGDGSLAILANKHPLNPDPTNLGTTAPDVIHMGSWYYLELQATISHTGSVTLRVNNIPLLTATGVDTVGDNADNTPMTADLRSIEMACTTNAAWHLDDLYVLDSTGSSPWNTFLGDSRIEYLRPRAAGTNQAWSLTGAASHWQAVDDTATPNDDTSYLAANAVDLIDTQLYQPTGLPSGPIYGAQFSLLAKKTETGPRTIAPVANGVVGTAVAPSEGSYYYTHTMYQTNPATSAAWTISGINSAEFGVKVVS